MDSACFNPKNFLLFCFVLITGHAFAQDNAIKDNKFIAGISPASLVDVFDGISVRANAEVKLYNNISFALEGGYYTNLLTFARLNPKGYLFTPSIKYYLNHDKKVYGNYLSLEYQYKNIDYELNDSIKMADVAYKKQYPMHRTVNCLSLKYGELEHFGKHWFIEYYCGLGIRFISSQAFNLTDAERAGEFKSASAEDQDGDSTSYYLRKTGDIVNLNIIAGIKIGYRIK